jgi:hypothetical protein
MLLVGASLNGIGSDGFAIPQAPKNFVNAQAENWDFLILLTTSRLLDKIIRSLKLSHEEQDEALVPIPFKVVQVASVLLREVFEVFA